MDTSDLLVIVDEFEPVGQESASHADFEGLNEVKSSLRIVQDSIDENVGVRNLERGSLDAWDETEGSIDDNLEVLEKQSESIVTDLMETDLIDGASQVEQNGFNQFSSTSTIVFSKLIASRRSCINVDQHAEIVRFAANDVAAEADKIIEARNHL